VGQYEHHTGTIEKGVKVSHIGRNTEIPSSRAGCLTVRGGLLRAGGSGAPSVRPRLTVVALGLVLLVLLVPSVASAHFVRPFVRQITETPLTGAGEVTAGSDVVESVVTVGGAFAVGEEIEGEGIPAGTTILFVGSGKLSGVLILSAEAEETVVSDTLTIKHPFNGPEGIAVDGEEDLWVLEGGNSLYEFGPSGAYRETLQPPSLNGAESVAIGPAGAMYISSTHRNGERQLEIFSKSGVLEKTFRPPGGLEWRLAVDNSTDPLDPSAGDLYVSGSDLEGTRLQRFSAAGEPEPWEHFKASKGCACTVSGNEIILANSSGEGGSVAVDPVNGDILVDSNRVVHEFTPGGELVREITGEEATGVDGGQGFYGEQGSSINGLAVDPTNGDMLVFLEVGTGSAPVGGVDEFNPEGAFVGQIAEADGQPLSGAGFGLAVDAHGDVYVVNSGMGGPHAVDEFAAGHFVPRLRLAAATQSRPASVVLNGSVDAEYDLNPDREPVTDCRFEYVSEAAFQKTGFEDLSSGGEVPCEHPDAGEIPRSEVYTAVHALVSEHVESGVTYRYRLSATISGGPLGGTEQSAPLTFTAAHAPAVSGTAVSGVTSAFAQFSGDVAPLGADTTYEFQYLTEVQFRANGGSWVGPDAPASAPAAPVDIGSGGEAGDLTEAVVQRVGGLEPETTYRYRLLASNEAGVSEGEVGEKGGEVVHLFTTEPVASGGLPDGRAYELVTPADKGGAQDMFGETFRGEEESADRGVASESGDQFMLSTAAAFGPFPASGLNVDVFSRHPSGDDPEREEWGFSSLVSPTLGIQSLGADLEALGSVIDPSDFSRVAINDSVGQFASALGDADAVLLGSPGGPYTMLHKDQFNHAVLPGTGTGFPQETTFVVGGSRDLGVLVLRSNNGALAEGGLCAGDVCSPPVYNLYEWVDGELKPLDLKSDGEPVGSCGAVLGGGDRVGERGTADGAVSEDGSKVFFTAPIPLEEAYHEEFGGSKGCPTRAGGKVANPAQLYVRSGEETVEVSAPEKGAPEHSAEYEAHYARAAEDGSRVFFSSEGELTANDAGIHDNELYEYDTETGKLTRVSAGVSGHAAGGVLFDTGNSEKAVTVSSDGSHVYFVAQGVLAPANAEGGAPVEGQDNLYVYDAVTGHTAFIAPAFVRQEGAEGAVAESGEATSDGRFLLFRSGSEVTPGAGAGQLYRYDADTEGVVCVSCNPGGSAAGSVSLPAVIEKEPQNLAAHSISEDGSYVFFDTSASLVPRDTDGVLDVYEWHEGRISLLSSGQDSLPSYFLGASANGANVFFGTHARLVPADTDSQGDVYDARICTASERCIEPAPAREGLCEGDACSHPAQAPNDATPASLTFAGAGDLAPPAPSATVRAKTCAKPKKLSHGKCVTAKPKRRKTKAKPGGRKTAAKRVTRSEKRGKRS
jgi:hypothetical protein